MMFTRKYNLKKFQSFYDVLRSIVGIKDSRDHTILRPMLKEGIPVNSEKKNVEEKFFVI